MESRDMETCDSGEIISGIDTPSLDMPSLALIQQNDIYGEFAEPNLKERGQTMIFTLANGGGPRYGPGSYIKQWLADRWARMFITLGSVPNSLALISLVVFNLMLLGHLQAVNAEQRFALVIGNSNYKAAPLLNPRNDASLMATTLRELGFQVAELLDADQRTMKRAVLLFGRNLRNSDAVGLFYYAGHGVQVDGENYLIPIGANIIDASEVAVEGLSLSEMFQTMERAVSRINIAIFDACRNNPYVVSGRGGERGLAQVLAPSGSFIAYATAPGQLAYDGTDGNSPYTKALTRSLMTPGLTIEEVFRRTRRIVLTQTEGKQTPWESSSLTGEFFFKAAPKPKPGAQKSPKGAASALAAQLDMTLAQAREYKAWSRTKEADTAAAYRLFIDAFPDGMFVELARMSLPARAGMGERPWHSVFLARNPAVISPAAQKILNVAKASLLRNDMLTAVKFFRKAANLGAAEAMFELAKLHDKGKGVPRSLQKSAFWYREAAKLGHGPSLNGLGNMYEFGDGVEKNLAEALQLYQAAAEMNDAAGMTSLAVLYAKGKGVTRDLVQARKWYGLAAQAGNRRAMFYLAELEIQGKGGRRDLADAAKWLQQAAAKGHSGAMRQLAGLYQSGQGVRKKPREASRLLLAAFIAGNKRTFEELFVRPETWSRSTRRHLQLQLKRKGVFKGRTTGYIGPKTRQALLSLQRLK